MKKLFLVLAFVLPLSITARNIRPIDLQESEFDILDSWFL